MSRLPTTLARTFAALATALLLGGSALSAATPGYPTGRFTVAGIVVPPAQILDARALPDATGRPSLMVTLAPAAAKTVAAGAHGTGELPVTLDGRALGTSAAALLAQGGVVQFSGDFGSYDAAGAIARRISGKDPVPESESDE